MHPLLVNGLPQQVTPPPRASEIIYGSGYPQTAFDWWMNDQVHRERNPESNDHRNGRGLCLHGRHSLRKLLHGRFCKPIKSHDRYSKNNHCSVSPFAVERLRPDFSRDSHKTTRPFCHLDSAAYKAGVDPADASPADSLTDLGSLDSHPTPSCRDERGLRRRCDLPR